MSNIKQTGFKLAQTVISNGEFTGNPWSNPNNLLLVDGDISQSNPSVGVASDVIIGNFNTNLPQDAIITGIQMKIIGYRGAQTSPVITLSPNAVDNTDGNDVIYEYITPFTGLTEDMAEHILGGANYLFDTTWDADKINNFKMQLVSNGDIYIDAGLLNVFYYIPESPTPIPVETENCETCNSQIQAQPFALALAFKIGETKFRLKSFKFPNGTDITYADLGDCGGYIDFVFDAGKPKVQGSNFEENVRCSSWEILADGTVEFDIVSTDFRGLSYHEPISSDASRMSDHDVNSQVIISNNSPFYERFLKRCHIGVLVSAPIEVLDENTQVAKPVTKFNFIGDSVQAVQNDGDSEQVDISIINNPTNIEPTVEDTSEGTTGTTPATSLTISHTITSANYLRVWISTDDETISSVEYDGVAMTLIASETNGPADLKVALYGLINPNAGTNDIIITMAGASNITAGGVSFLDVDTSNPTDGISSGAIGTSTAPSDTVTTTTQNTVMQDVVGGVTNATTFTQSYPWTIQEEVNVADRTGASSIRKVLSPATLTDTYTIGPSQAWAIIMAGVRGGVNTNLGVQSVTGLDTDNTDPQNPVVQIAVDGSTITGDGTPGNPLVATGGGGGSGEVVQKTFTQVAHGFSVGDVLKSSGTDGEFNLAQADVVTNADAIGIVTDVPDADTFVLTTEGFVVISSLPGGAVTGDNFFLSPSTPGELTLTDPAIANVPGTVSFPLGTVIDDSTGLCNIHKYRPQEQQSTPSGIAAYTVNADETEATYDTHEIDMPYASHSNGWTLANISNQIKSAFGYLYSGFNGGSALINFAYASSGGSTYRFNTGKITRFKFKVAVDAGATNGNAIAFGLGDGGTSNFPDETTTDISIKFVWKNVSGTPTLFTVTSDGTGNTNNSSTSFTLTNQNIYEIVWTPGVDVKFYVNGNLVATHTTDIPTSSSAISVELINNNSNSNITITKPVISLEL